MKAHRINLIALAGAVALTATGLAALHASTPVRAAPARSIGGIEVIDLAPVEVRPGAEELRAAALLDHAGMASAVAIPAFSDADQAAGEVMRMLGKQLTMPYYSFGNRLVGTGRD